MQEVYLSRCEIHRLKKEVICVITSFFIQNVLRDFDKLKR